ncbi:hypothetical protein C8J57DRAFT_717364 [Mycena rebaudengoi]|nr:hypothetical protein C8J57DRAFT_717364 [Mycena rebaudengoi]
MQSTLLRLPRNTVARACAAARRHTLSSARRPLAFSARRYSSNAVNDLESCVAISTTKIGAIVAPGRPAHWSDSPVDVARLRSFNGSHSFESDSLMPFDPPSRARRQMKDSAVAAVAQGPYCLLYHSRRHFCSSTLSRILMGLTRTANALRLWAGILSFDLEYSRLNPFSISLEDYPVGWESGQHPDDYQILSAPLKPEFFVAPRRRHDTLLWYRTCFKLGKDKFLPMSFLIWDLNPT